MIARRWWQAVFVVTDRIAEFAMQRLLLIKHPDGPADKTSAYDAMVRKYMVGIWRMVNLVDRRGAVLTDRTTVHDLNLPAPNLRALRMVCGDYRVRPTTLVWHIARYLQTGVKP